MPVRHRMPRKLLQTTEFAFGLTLLQFSFMFIQVVVFMAISSLFEMDRILIVIFWFLVYLAACYGVMRFANSRQRGVLKHYFYYKKLNRETPLRYSGRDKNLDFH